MESRRGHKLERWTITICSVLPHSLEQLVMAYPPSTVDGSSYGPSTIIGLRTGFIALLVAILRRGVRLKVAHPHALAPAVLASLASVQGRKNEKRAGEETGNCLVADHGDLFV